MKKIEISQAFYYGWESIKKDFWYLIAINLIVTVIGESSSLFRHNSFYFLIQLLVLILTVILQAGLIHLLLKYYDGKKQPIADLFTQTQFFWRFLGGGILIGLIVVGGFILLIIPGIYWALKYTFVPNLIVDKNLSVSEAMAQSGRMTKGVKLRLFVFYLSMFGIMILGAMALGVGIIVAMPIVHLAKIDIYRKLLTESLES